MNRPPRRAIHILKRLVALVSLAALVTAPVSAHASPLPLPGECVRFDVPVTVDSESHAVRGTLCLPDLPTHAVMVLVHGSTYNHVYWNFPHQPHLYNFRSAMNSAGYATAVIDKLGSGRSSRPLSTQATKDTQIDAVHAVIQALRAGQVGGQTFAKVIVGGHSNGSTDAIGVAWKYPQDADGVLITGFTHRVNIPQVLVFLASTYAASLDPKFMNAQPPYDPGYITTMPGTREANFYAPGSPEPGVVALDEATKDVLSLGESAGGTEISDNPAITQSIDVPVLMAHGELDTIFHCSEAGLPCTAGALYAQEAPYFSAGACLQVHVQPEAGHVINLFSNAHDTWDAVTDWAHDFVGVGVDPVTPPAGACS